MSNGDLACARKLLLVGRRQGARAEWRLRVPVKRVGLKRGGEICLSRIGLNISVVYPTHA